MRCGCLACLAMEAGRLQSLVSVVTSPERALLLSGGDPDWQPPFAVAHIPSGRFSLPPSLARAKVREIKHALPPRRSYECLSLTSRFTTSLPPARGRRPILASFTAMDKKNSLMS